VTPEQVPQARQLMDDEGASISEAARMLNVSRASLNRALDREHLSNRDTRAELAKLRAFKLGVEILWQQLADDGERVAS
jgi:hypothetical protein